MLNTIVFLATRRIETWAFWPDMFIWKFDPRSGQMTLTDEWHRQAMLDINRFVMKDKHNHPRYMSEVKAQNKQIDDRDVYVPALFTL